MIYFETLDGLFFTLYDPCAMEHAVPQNVTSFEFHLVGDMTLKQFGYLAAGSIAAYIAFATLFSVLPILSVLLVGLFSITGVLLAFVPIADRPLDHWIVAFFKAIYSPTQGVWKPGAAASKNLSSKDPAFKSRLQAYLSSFISPQPAISVAQPAPVPLTRLPTESRIIQPQTNQPIGITVEPTASKVAVPQLSSWQANTQPVPKEQAVPVQPTITSFPTSPATPPAILGQPIKQSEPAITPSIPTTQAANINGLTNPMRNNAAETTSTPVARQSLKTQLLLTSFPNVINGIVTDTAGNYLEGVIISIHDKNGLPVRALKTNKLGQFTGATPLPDGNYTVTFDKESLYFDTLQVTLTGGIMPPLTLSAKKGGTV